MALQKRSVPSVDIVVASLPERKTRARLVSSRGELPAIVASVFLIGRRTGVEMTKDRLALEDGLGDSGLYASDF